MACLLRYQRLNPGLTKTLTKCFIISEGSEQSTQCQDISLCPGGGRKGTHNKLTPQSSISKMVQARDRLCQEKHTHTCARTDAPSIEGFHIQLSASDANESSPHRYHSISFQQFPLLVSCPLLVHGTAHQSQAVCVVLSSWPKWDYVLLSLRPFMLRKFEEQGFRLLLFVFLLSPATPSFQ